MGNSLVIVVLVIVAFVFVWFTFNLPSISVSIMSTIATAPWYLPCRINKFVSKRLLYFFPLWGVTSPHMWGFTHDTKPHLIFALAVVCDGVYLAFCLRDRLGEHVMEYIALSLPSPHTKCSHMTALFFHIWLDACDRFYGGFVGCHMWMLTYNSRL